MAQRSTLAWLVPVVLLCGLRHGASNACASGESDVVWVHELDTNANLIGKEIVVEGRFGARLAPNRIQLQRSKVEFHLSDELAKKSTSGIRFIRLSGTLSRSNDKLVMQVTSLSKITTTDAERYEAAARRLGKDDVEGWERLADRVQRLADFYGEKELRELTDQARRSAFRAKEAGLRPNQVNELLALAEAAKEVGLDESEARRLRHKAMRFRLDALTQQKATAADWRALAKQIGELLPRALKPLTAGAEARLAAYRKNPLAAYASDLTDRDAYDRDLWASAFSQSLLLEATRPAADLFKFSEEAKQSAPDYAELWRQLRGQWAESEKKRVPTMPDSQVRNLAKILRVDLGKPDQADDVLRGWLAGRRAKLGVQDAEGRVRLAKNYRTDLKDTGTAGELLLEAIKIDPELAEAADELRALGFVKGPKGWVQNAGAGAPATASAPRGNLPGVGMTPDQVRQRLGDPRPEDIVRVLTANGQYVEQWAYRDQVDIHVTFRRSRSSPLQVVAVTTQSEK